ncbi:hypothetical protein BCD72_001059 [Clostridium butyricum]|nr:hypothetical protein [Clostridium butyricum]NOW36524.1 hypothetical protein [Clostridium butyricum]
MLEIMLEMYAAVQVAVDKQTVHNGSWAGTGITLDGGTALTI